MHPQRFSATYGYGANGGADRRVAFLHLGRVKIPFPIGRQRPAFVPIHDVNHLAPGHDTSRCGEARVAAWEAGRAVGAAGCRSGCSCRRPSCEGWSSARAAFLPSGGWAGGHEA